MTEDQIGLVRDSFAKVAPIAPAAASLFYGRLFTLDPSLKSLFTGDMEEQGEKLMMMIATVVGSLDRFEQIAPRAPTADHAIELLRVRGCDRGRVAC